MYYVWPHFDEMRDWGQPRPGDEDWTLDKPLKYLRKRRFTGECQSIIRVTGDIPGAKQYSTSPQETVAEYTKRFTVLAAVLCIA
jgi:hypothetical protein